MTTETRTRECADLFEMLDRHRGFLRYTARDLTDAQAAQRTTVSSLSIGGLIKHVAAVEEGWMEFVLHGPQPLPDDFSAWEENFRMLEGETLSALLDRYAQVARRTTEIVDGLPDLDGDHPLPEAPWNAPGERWSARRVLLHLIAETSQHAGHADIIRESLDGSKTMA